MAGMDPASTGAATRIVEVWAGAVRKGGVAGIMAAAEATAAAVIPEAEVIILEAAVIAEVAMAPQADIVVAMPEVTGVTDQAV